MARRSAGTSGPMTGCTLGAIDRFAYPDQPAEVPLL
jgi:hypothetical protein